jgi:ribosomal protein L16/L10AE
MLFEIGGIADDKMKEALHQAGFKLPIRTKIVKRTKALSEAEKLKMEAAARILPR